MKKTISLVRSMNDWHNGDIEEKTYAFFSEKKAIDKAIRLNNKVEKWNNDNGIEIVYAEGAGKVHSFYENDYGDRFYVIIEKTTLDCEVA